MDQPQSPNIENNYHTVYQSVIATDQRSRRGAASRVVRATATQRTTARQHREQRAAASRLTDRRVLVRDCRRRCSAATEKNCAAATTGHGHRS